MIGMLRCFVVGMLAIPLLAHGGSCEDAETPLHGSVRDAATGQLLRGAEVAVERRVVTTSAEGAYTLTGLPERPCIAVARAVGYETKTATVGPLSRDSTSTDFALERRPRASRVLFVAPDGDDAKAGTEDAPGRTLRHAVESIRPGDAVYVRAGVYHEHVRLRVHGATDAWTLLAACPGERVVVDGTGVADTQNGLVVTSSYLRLEGLEIRN